MAAPADTTSTVTGDAMSKPIHSLVLDTGPLVKNDPTATALRSKAQQLYTIPSVVSEIRDAATRSRVETTLMPFVTIRSPRLESIKFVTGFARKTGDLDVLSRPDLEVLALGYELECERNHGDWRLRNAPGQKGLNGRPNTEERSTETGDTSATQKLEGDSSIQEKLDALDLAHSDEKMDEPADTTSSVLQTAPTAPEEPETSGNTGGANAEPELIAQDDQDRDDPEQQDEVEEEEEEEEDEDDEGGWITPSNLKKRQAEDSNTSTPAQPLQKTLQAAVLTSDYAMQNVALRMNLNLVAPSLARITQLKTWVLRCHGCFQITKDTSRQFCPSCGQPTLIRTSCSTDEHGNFRVHLKRNFQWNNRGNVYSVPKPVHGSTNGRLPKKNASGGKNGWGRDLILAEDQKEYTKAIDERRRTRKKDIMDDDLLPGILSGERSNSGGKIRVGPGRGVNSRGKHR